MALLRPRAPDRGRRPQPKRQADRSASARWKYPAITIARLIFALVFAQAAVFKFVLVGMDATAAEIAGAGFPFPLLLA